jgi:mannose-6-phosphate isomerase
MGVHGEGPSATEYAGKAVSLPGLIAQDPEGYLGTQAARSYGTLPFLFKLLGIEKPLSIQVHPNRKQAQEGFERENRQGIPLSAAHRNYKDPYPKPEIICALSPFTALCGFREPEVIAQVLTALAEDAAEPLQDALLTLTRVLGPQPESLKAFLAGLFALPMKIRTTLSAYVQERMEALIKAHPGYTDAWRLCAYFAQLYPGDPAVIAPLYLNLISLESGEGIYLPTGVLHAYVKGFGVELMANSDNVLRGGLSSKYVDSEELLRILDFSVFRPQILHPDGSIFKTPSEEFALWVREGRGDQIQHPERLPGILMVTQGELRLSCDGEAWAFKSGESFFIPALRREDIRLSGTYRLYGAGLGSPYEDTGGR